MRKSKLHPEAIVPILVHPAFFLRTLRCNSTPRKGIRFDSIYPIHVPEARTSLMGLHQRNMFCIAFMVAGSVRLCVRFQGLGSDMLSSLCLEP